MSLHVLVLPSWYRTPRRPVLGTFFEEQARALLDQGARVGVLHPALEPFRARFDPDCERLPPDAVDDGLPTFRAQAWAPLPRVRALAHASLERAAWRSLARYESAHGRPDVLHAHSAFHAGLVGARLARRIGVPLVFTEHLAAILDPAWPARRAEARELREAFARADRALVVSTALRDGLERFGVDRAKVEVVPNMVASEFFEGVGTPPPGPRAALLSMSYLVPRKRVDLLLRGFALVRRSRPELELRVGGDGPERARLVALAAELGLAEHVAFLGSLTRERVREELARCHVFVQASRHETFGVALAEALAAGRPVVSTDSGGVRDVVDVRDGILVREHEAEPLAAAIDAVLDRRTTFDADDLSRRCRARFAPDVIARRLLAIYAEELERARRAAASRARA